MKMGRVTTGAGILTSGLLALVIAAAPAPASAQVDQGDDCRCVARDGDEIENCTCFRMPSFEWQEVNAFSFNRPRLGISVDANQGADADARGALVTDVLEDGPADEAGIREGDLITSLNGQALFESLDEDTEADFNLDQSIPVQRLLAIARELEPGDEVEVEYLRDDRTQTTMVEAEDLSDWGRVAMVGPGWDSEEFAERMRELAERTREMEFRFGPEFQEELQDRIRDREMEMRFRGPDRDIRILSPRGGAPNVMIDGMRIGRDGLELAELNPELGQYFGAGEGVLVLDIDEDSGLGLQPGDVILSVGDREAATPGRVYRILGSYGDDEEIRFRVRRDGAEIDVMGRL